MQALVVRTKTRRRSRRRNFKLFKSRVAERLSMRDDPNVVGNVIITHEYALKRMHRARISVPSAAVMVRRHVASEHAAKENPVSTLSQGAKWLGYGALAAVAIYAASLLVGAVSIKQDTLPSNT
jgi:hypothetical protein